MTTGRDSYVRIVRSGYLFPFTLRAVSITDLLPTANTRCPRPATSSRTWSGAEYVEITQPTRTYEGHARAVRRPARPAAARSPPRRSPRRRSSRRPTSRARRRPTRRSGCAPRRRRQILVRRRRLGEAWQVDFSAGVIWVDELDADDAASRTPWRASTRAHQPLAAPIRHERPAGGVRGRHRRQAGLDGPARDLLEFGGENHRQPLPLTPAWYPLLGEHPAFPQPSRSPGPVVGASAAAAGQFPSQFYNNGFQAGLPEIFLQVTKQAGLNIPPNLAGGMATPKFHHRRRRPRSRACRRHRQNAPRHVRPEVVLRHPRGQDPRRHQPRRRRPGGHGGQYG